MNVREAMNRGNNLLAVGLVGFLGVAFSPEFLMEGEWQFKLDDGLLFILGLIAIGWYFTGKNKFSRSIMPLIFVVGGFAIKLMGFIIEIQDTQEFGQDFTELIVFFLAILLVGFIYLNQRKQAN